MRTKEAEDEEAEAEEEGGSRCGSLVEGDPAAENWTGERKITAVRVLPDGR